MIYRILAATALFLTSCTQPTTKDIAETGPHDAKPEIAEYCSRNPVQFNKPLDLSLPRDAAIAKRLGAYCDALVRQDGLDFGDNLTTYECAVFIPRMTYDEAVNYAAEISKRTEFSPSQEDIDRYLKSAKAEDDRIKEIENHLGVSLALSQFHSAVNEPDDLAEYEYAMTKDQGPESQKSMPLGYFSLFNGVTITILILGDQSGKVQRTLMSRDEMASALRKVTSIAGGINLLDLRKQSEMIYSDPRDDGMVSGNYYACQANSIEASDAGWIITAAPIKRNCRTIELRDFEISRNGTTTITKRTGTDIPSICVD